MYCELWIVTAESTHKRMAGDDMLEFSQPEGKYSENQKTLTN